MPTFIVDFSFAHATVTPAALAKLDGCIGGIAYAGCNDSTKNITKAQLHALLDAGFQMGLVIENVATDAIGGAAVGTAQGKAIVAAAKALGYDWQNCVLVGGYDTNAHAGDYAELLAFEKAFAAQAPVPGYYGDSDSIDYLHTHGSVDWLFWQSDSGSFSPKNPTPNAHLWQQFNDPRAAGLRSSVDVNNILRTPLHLMGEDDMSFTIQDLLNTPIDGVDGSGKPVSWTLQTWIHYAGTQANAARQSADDTKAELDAVKAAIAKLTVGGVDPVAVAQAIAQHVKLAAT